MPWVQVYDPLGQAWLSTLAAALPTGLLLVALAVLRWPAHRAAALGLAAAAAVSVGVFGMPARAALATALYGAAYGLFPIGWIVLCAIFLYNLSVKSGTFDIVKRSVARLSGDRRVQALLIAFSFGAFIEGCAGFGAPVAISAALLAGLGFAPRYAASLALIANTAPVAFGSLAIPIFTLAAVTGLPADALGAMAGRQLPFVSVLVPAWLVVTMSGWRGLRGVWPAVAACGGTFASVQFAWSNFIGPELVDITAALLSLGAVGLLCVWWQPADVPRPAVPAADGGHSGRIAPRELLRGWLPWILLTICVTVWGAPSVKAALSAPSWSAPRIEVPALHRRVFRDFPVVPAPVDRTRLGDGAYREARAEAAIFTVNWASATGTSVLAAALGAILLLRMRRRDVADVARATWRQMRIPLITISTMMALGFITRYGGTDATLGLAFTKTGWFYPFFAAMLGWLGVALTGSDTSSNVLFGSLQKITAQQLGLDPVLIAASNSSGGVMGKMIAAQTIVVATAATNQQGEEGALLRSVFWHSVALASIVGLIVMAQAYLVPWMVPRY